MKARISDATPLLAMLAVVAALLGTYVAGYFWLGRRMDHLGLSAPMRIEVIERHYSQPWMAGMYRPAGKVEELVRRIDVEIVSEPPATWRSIDFR